MLYIVSFHYAISIGMIAILCLKSSKRCIYSKLMAHPGLDQPPSKSLVAIWLVATVLGSTEVEDSGVS